VLRLLQVLPDPEGRALAVLVASCWTARAPRAQWWPRRATPSAGRHLVDL